VAAVAVLDRLAALACRPGVAAAFGLWAAAEAIVLPVVPDVGLCLVVLAAPRFAPRLFVAVVVGAVAGTLLLGVFVDRTPAATEAMLLALPGIDESVLSDAEGRLARDGVAGFAQIGIGPPLKVYTSAWLNRGGDLPGLIAGSVLNRLTRVGLPLLVAALGGATFGSWFWRHARTTMAAYAVFWIVVYASIWT
jgi:hypothetical protein